MNNKSFSTHFEVNKHIAQHVTVYQANISMTIKIYVCLPIDHTY